MTRHKRSGRFEAHIWNARAQTYLGGWQSEKAAARAHDVACLHCRGHSLNYPQSDYTHVIPLMHNVSFDELVALLRRRSRGFTRGRSNFRGVTRHKSGRFEARISGRQTKQCAYCDATPARTWQQH